MSDGDLSKFVGNADLFPVLRNWHFFNHAGVAPLPRSSADAIRKFVDEAERQSYIDAAWWTDLDELRGVAARFINASTPGEIAFLKNTSEGISLVANGLDWKAGDRVVTTNVEYPANVYPWMALQRLGVELVMVPEETDPATGHRQVPVERILAAAAEPRVRLVTLSHVEYASGQRHDLARIGAFCRSRGILFNVDAIQSLGAVPVDVQAMNVDFLSADGHKWMLGPEGAGFLYVRRALLDQLRPMMYGATSVVDPMNYGDYNFTLKPDASRYESGTNPLPGLLGLKASLELLLEAGMANVASRIKSQGDRLIAGLTDRGYAIVSPRTGDAWSGIVSFTSRDPATHRETAAMLRSRHKIEIAVREGRLRASPHFYNTPEQIDVLIAALPKP